MAAKKVDLEKLAEAALDGKPASLKRLMSAVKERAASNPGPYGRDPGYDIWEAWSVFCTKAYQSRDFTLVRKTLWDFTATLEKRPHILPHSMKAKYLLKDEGIPFLLKCAEFGLRFVTPAGLKSLDKNIAHASSKGLELLEDAVEGMFEFVGGSDIESEIDADAAEKFAAGLNGWEWSDHNLNTLFRVLSKGYLHSLLPGPFTAAAILPLLDKARGPGKEKLAVHLARAGHKLGDGPKNVTTLPVRMPLEVPDAIALIKKYQLTDEDLELYRGGKPGEIRSLGEALETRVPEEVLNALKTHLIIGEIEFGPPARMVGLREQIRETLEEHLKEYSDLEETNQYRDVRAYDPLKSGIPLGTNSSGDVYFLAVNAKSDTGHHPVICFHHDMALTSSIAASSLGEYLALTIAQPYARREGLVNELNALWNRKRSAVIA